MSYNIKQVIVIRKDLKMRRGKESAQASHASMKVLLDLMQKTELVYSPSLRIERLFTVEKGSYLNQWLEGSFAKIVVSCNSEEELLELQKQAKEANILNALITDAGATEFNGVPTVTCLAIGPHSSEEINKITGNLKLL